ncbi:MAG: hypothetical protein ABI639_12130 [Thermoanaerobaculia bacterium]
MARGLPLALPLAMVLAMGLAMGLTLRVIGGAGGAGGTGGAGGVGGVGGGGDPEALFLALWTMAVFLPLALLASARRPPFALFALIQTALVVFLPRSGGLRPVAVAGGLVLTVLVLAALEFAPAKTPAGIRAWAGISLATAFLLRGHLLFEASAADPTLAGRFSSSALFGLLFLPALATGIAARLARAGRPGAAASAGALILLAPQAGSEPWWIAVPFAALAIAASLDQGVRGRQLSFFAQRGLLIYAGLTLFAATFPWLRAAPVATLLQAAVAVDRQIAETPLHDRVVVLTAASPRFASPLAGESIRTVVVDSYLTHGVDLACDVPLARVEVTETSATTPNEAPSVPPQSFGTGTLVSGRDSAEWAAGRIDVAARLACPAPAPWISWIPGAGRFLGRTSRARISLASALSARSLVIERDPNLPAETSLALFFVGTER